MINRMRRFRLFVLMAGIINFSSCDDLVEKDISDVTVQVIGPSDAMIVNYSTITFWWEEVDGASAYRLQLVSPSFENPVRLVLDTLVGGTDFDYTPAIGNYEWRIRAENSAYRTMFSLPRKLEIKPGDDLSQVVVILRSPVNNSVSSDTLVRFSWDQIPIATSYKLIVEGGASVDTVLQSNAFSYRFLKKEATYFWQVEARNESSASLSGSNQFVIDPVPPQSPVLQTPEADSAFNMANAVTFRWLRENEQVVADSFFVEKRSDANTWAVFGGFTPRRLSVPEITLSRDDFTGLSTADSYRWAVISIDRAGNRSPVVHRPFTIGSL